MSQPTVVPTLAGSLAPRRGDRSLGALLVDAGKLSAQDAERVLRLQRDENLRFGDAALKLGLVTAADIEQAIARQFDYPFLLAGQSSVSSALVAAYEPFSPRVEALRTVRSQLMLRWFDSDPARKALAVLSAERGEGRSYVAANLAVVFSQLGEHTLLIDADLRNPCQHQLFGLENRAGLSSLLSGRGDRDALVHKIPALVDLSVLTAGAVPPNPLELLSRPLFAHLLAEFAREFDVIILDTPAAGEFADAQTITVRAGCALIVARRNSSRNWQVRGVSDTVTQAHATIVGTVLNDF